MGFHLQALVTPHLDAGSAIEPPTPIAPEDRRCPDGQGMEQETDLARFGRVAAFPLTLPTQRTGTATADAGSLDQADTPVRFWTPLLQG